MSTNLKEPLKTYFYQKFVVDNLPSLILPMLAMRKQKNKGTRAIC